MPDESIIIMEDAEKDDFYEEPTQNGDLPSNESADEKELLFQGTSDLMLYLDTFGRIVKINKAGLAFSGFTKEEAVGKHFWKLLGVFSKRNAPKYLKVFKNALKGEPTRSFVGKLDDKSGKTYIMDFSAFPIKENKKLKYVLVISKDITEEKEIENKYKLISENTSDLICLTTFKMNPTYTYVSPSYKNALGYEPSDLIGKPCFDFMSPDDKKNLLPLLKKYIGMKAKKFLTEKSLDVSEKFETCVRDTSGGWHYMETTANLMGDELLFISKDITERKKAEGALHESKERFRTIWETSQDSIFIKDHKLRYSQVNPAMEKLFGIPTTELIGKTDDDLFEEEAATRIKESDSQVLSGEVIKEEHTKSVNGIPYTFHVIKVPMRDKTGKVIGLYGIARDITELRRAEEESIRLSNAVKMSTDSIVISDLNGKIIDVNDATLKMHGTKDKGDLIGKKSLDLIATEDREKAFAGTKETLEKGYVGSREYHVVIKDGSKFPVEMSSAVMKDANDKPIGFVGITRDITERKKKEEEIRYLKEYNENILESNPNPIIVIKGDQIEYVNNSFVSTFGKTKDDYVSKDLEEVMPSETISTFEELLRDNDKIKELDVKGKSFSVSLFVVKKAEEEEEEERMGIILQDITERKKAEESIKENEQRLNTILENLQSGIVIIDAETHSIVDVNPLASKMIGIPKEKIIGKICHEFICPAERGKCPITDLGQKVDNSERVLVNANGKEVPILKTVISVMMNNHKYLIDSFIDITNRKKAEEKIKRQNMQLKKLDRIKTDFLNVTSHELRTPMAAIKGYIQMLLKQTLGDVTPEQKDALNVVLRNTDRLDHLVQDILDISRLESGTMKFIPEKTDISKMIKESLQTMQYNAEMKNIKINTELGKNIPTLFIDQERIKQVITNLVDNAIKFSPPDSTVMIRAKKDKSDVLFEVQDFGRGIPKNKQKKIFERFYQVESGMDRKFGGVGLGLTISQNIVKFHGGNIWVDNSTKDKGSTFKFNLPIDSVENIE